MNCPGIKVLRLQRKTLDGAGADPAMGGAEVHSMAKKDRSTLAGAPV